MLMLIAVGLFFMLALFMLVGVVPGGAGPHVRIFQSPVFALLLLTVAVMTLMCCFRRRRGWRDAAFLLCHVGAVFVLFGAGLRALRGVQFEAAVPVNRQHVVRRLVRQASAPIDLGFGLTVTSFEVSYYPPSYRLWPPAGSSPKPSADSIPRFSMRDGVLKVGSHGPVAAAVLLDRNGQWKHFHVLSDGFILEKLPPVARSYTAELRFTAADGSTQEDTLRVNAPVKRGGWWFHLQSYDPQGQRYVVLGVKRDQGRPMAIGGMWALMLGTALLGFRPGIGRVVKAGMLK